MAAGSAMAIQVDRNTCDKVVSTGTLDVTGALLNGTLVGVTKGTTYVIAEAGHVAGTFAGLDDGATVQIATGLFTIRYTGTTITLTCESTGVGSIYIIR